MRSVNYKNFFRYAGDDNVLSAAELSRLQASQNKRNLAAFDKDGDGVLDETEMVALEASKAKPANATDDVSTSPESVSQEDADDKSVDLREGRCY